MNYNLEIDTGMTEVLSVTDATPEDCLRALATPLPEGEKAGDVLRQAAQAELILSAHSTDALRLCENLLNRTIEYQLKSRLKSRSPRQADRNALMATIQSFTADLLRASKNLAALGFCYRSKGRNFDGTQTSRRFFERLVEAWTAMGWIEERKGFQTWGTFDSDHERIPELRTASRFRARPVFLSRCLEAGLTPSVVDQHFSSDASLSDFVKVSRCYKKDNTSHMRLGRNMVPTPSAKFHALCQTMSEINTFLAHQDFNLARPPQLKRCFNNGDHPDFDWNMGGRLFSIGEDGYQNLKKRERKKIRINGEPTVELDVRASHLTIAHALVGAKDPLPENPYQVPGLPREVVKKAIVIGFGRGQPPRRWPGGEKGELASKLGITENEIPPISEVWCEAAKRLPVLDQIHEGRIDWSILQFHESEAFLKAILRLKDKGIPSLPVHDSLIVPVSFEEAAKTMIQDCYQIQVGATPTIVSSSD